MKFSGCGNREQNKFASAHDFRHTFEKAGRYSEASGRQSAKKGQGRDARKQLSSAGLEPTTYGLKVPSSNSVNPYSY